MTDETSTEIRLAFEAGRRAGIVSGIEALFAVIRLPLPRDILGALDTADIDALRAFYTSIIRSADFEQARKAGLNVGDILIEGTDIPLYQVAALHQTASVDVILTDYPSLTLEQVEAAIAHAERDPPPPGLSYPSISLKRALVDLWARLDDDGGNDPAPTSLFDELERRAEDGSVAAVVFFDDAVPVEGLLAEIMEATVGRCLGAVAIGKVTRLAKSVGVVGSPLDLAALADHPTVRTVLPSVQSDPYPRPVDATRA